MGDRNHTKAVMVGAWSKSETFLDLLEEDKACSKRFKKYD